VSQYAEFRYAECRNAECPCAENFAIETAKLVLQVTVCRKYSNFKSYQKQNLTVLVKCGN